MSSDPALALQKAVIGALKGATEAGADVYDTVPKGDPFPRLTIDGMQTVGVFADCYDGSEVFFDLSAWGRPSKESAPAAGTAGYQQVQRIASQARSVLHDADLQLDGHTLELLEVQDTVYSRDPDGITRRARMTIRALTQPAA